MDEERATPSEAALTRELTLHQQVLRRVARDAPLNETLTMLTSGIDALLPGTRTAILIVNDEQGFFTIGATPPVPPAVWRSLATLPLGWATSSFERSDVRKVFLTSLAPRAETRDRIDSEAMPGFAATWTAPLLRADSSAPLGALTVFVSQHGPPNPKQSQSIRRLGDLAESALLRHERQQNDLRVVAHERIRIAGELRTAALPAMRSMATGLGVLRGSGAETETIEVIERLSELTESAVARLDQMLFQIHPESLTTDGLGATFRSLLEQQDVGVVSYRVDCDDTKRTTPRVDSLAFRLGREAILNALHHASAETIDVIVRLDTQALSVQISDDGIGFLRKATPTGHLGIRNCEDLAAAAGGTYLVTSTQGHGTTVTISLPTVLT